MKLKISFIRKNYVFDYYENNKMLKRVIIDKVSNLERNIELAEFSNKIKEIYFDLSSIIIFNNFYPMMSNGFVLNESKKIIDEIYQSKYMVLDYLISKHEKNKCVSAFLVLKTLVNSLRKIYKKAKFHCILSDSIKKFINKEETLIYIDQHEIMFVLEKEVLLINSFNTKKIEEVVKNILMCLYDKLYKKELRIVYKDTEDEQIELLISSLKTKVEKQVKIIVEKIK